MPTAFGANVALRKRRTESARSYFLHHPVNYATTITLPLDTPALFACTAKAKPFFGRTALAGCVNESLIDDDAVFSERDGPVGENDSQQRRPFLTLPTRAKNGGHSHTISPPAPPLP